MLRAHRGRLGKTDFEHALKNFKKSVNKGLLKVFSKMGISTLQSYRGAQIFEAIGLNSSLIEKYFTGTASRLEGIGLEVDPNMILEPRNNPYVRTDGWDEEVAKMKAKKAAA